MKNLILTLVVSVVVCGPMSLLWADAQTGGVVLAQDEDEFLGADEEDVFDENASQKRLEEERKKREEEEKRRREEEERKAAEAKRVAIEKQRLKERKVEELRKQELLSVQEQETTEYTLDPGSVELVVELDPNGYGFRTRSHRMTMSADVDLLLRGRSMLHYDYRFFNYLSIGVMGGLDWSDMSLYGRFREDSSNRFSKQLSLLGGASAKWRLSEWYMKSAVFLEPSLLFGHMWQNLKGFESKHWRLKPGLFVGGETVFDSGLSLSTKVGAEVPFDFGTANPMREVVEPLLVVGFGFAI